VLDAGVLNLKRKGRFGGRPNCKLLLSIVEQQRKSIPPFPKLLWSVLPDRSVGCGSKLGTAAVPVDSIRRPRALFLRRPGLADDVQAVERDVAHTAAERDEVTEVHFAVGAADEYEPVDVQLHTHAHTIRYDTIDDLRTGKLTAN